MTSIFDTLLSTLSGTQRVAHSTCIFLAKLTNYYNQEKASKQDIARLMREAFEELGATYIKLGQFIASAPTIFPREYVEEMQKCLDSVRPIPFHQIKAIIEKELKGKLSDYFISVQEKPIASASIAQVHAAITKEGHDVVIKVQRPDIEAVLKTDMNLIYMVVDVLSKFLPELKKSGVIEIVKDFKESILLEIDFYKEAKNIEEFDEFLLKTGEERAKVPMVYHRYSTKRILTMERLYGVGLTDLQSLRKVTSDPKETLNAALSIWFSSLSFNGVFHADVHAGNLMVLQDGRIGFIDFGIVGKISKKVWQGLMKFMAGIGTNEPYMMARGLIEMDSTVENIDETKFAHDLEKILYSMNKVALAIQMNNPEMIDEEKLNKLMLDLNDITKENGLKIPREFGLLIKQMLYFDRYVKLLAPEMDLLRDQRFYISYS